MRRLAATAMLVGLLVGQSTAAQAADVAPGGSEPDIDAYARGDYAQIDGRREGLGKHRDAGIRNVIAPRFVRRYAPACSGNAPSGLPSLDALCGTAANACAEPGDVLFWVFVAPAGPPLPADSDFVYANQTVCRGPGEVPAAAVPVFGVEDFRRLPLPAGVVHIQPPNGRTLVNVPTNVYVEAGTVTLPTALLGFPVRVRATPAHFRWRFGDGQGLTTEDQGAPYPHMTTTHTYTEPRTAKVSLVTVYTGEYSVAGGPFQPIDGTATVTSPAAALTVLAAENELVTGGEARG